MDLKTVLNGDISRRKDRPRTGRSASALIPALVAVMMLVTACGQGEASSAGDNQGNDEEKVVATGPSEAVVTISPDDGAKGVATTGTLGITAEKGRLTEVTVVSADGEKIPGEISRNGRVWKPKHHLATETEYRVKAIAKDSKGRTAAENTSFTTLVPGDTFVGSFQPEDGDKVGVGMPVSIEFSQPIEARAAVEEAISVTAEPKVNVEGHWFGDQRLDFRPKEYWKPGTKVTLDLNLDGVEGVEGVYGKQDKTVTFEIGRSQISVVDVEKKEMVVKRDGKRIETFPISAGAPATPTYNGTMVISQKHEVTRMNGATVGFAGEYDIKDVPHAMRLSTSGTFIHGNYWAAKSTFGSANTSHGCIGLYDVRGGWDKDTPGAWFFRNSMVGDIVKVKNSDDETIEPKNGLNGWNMSWQEWTDEQS